MLPVQTVEMQVHLVSSSTGPTEAINGRLETLRGIAMGFDNFEHYRQRSLIHSGRIKDILTH